MMPNTALYSVLIRVIDINTLQPVPATVALNSTVSPTPAAEATFTNVPKGTYTLTVTAPNYTPHTQPISVARNEIITVKLVPRAYLLHHSFSNSQECPECPKKL
jgi:hypothetical protein